MRCENPACASCWPDDLPICNLSEADALTWAKILRIKQETKGEPKGSSFSGSTVKSTVDELR